MTVIPRLGEDGCGCAAAAQSGLVSLDDALDAIDRLFGKVGPIVKRRPEEALSMILALDVRAKGAVPPFDSSAMDGYAVDSGALAGEGPWRLPLAGRVAAGEEAPALPPGHVLQVLTGAPVPKGATAIVPQEDVRVRSGKVELARRPTPGENIRLHGSDFHAGQTLLNAGDRLGIRHLAVCAAAGVAQVALCRPLRVALVVTGDEVIATSGARVPGAAAGIRDVNGPTIAAAIRAAGGSVTGPLHVPDRREDLGRVLEGLVSGHDLIVTTGGVSVGAEDHVVPTWRDLGGAPLVHGVAIKPGKPVAFGLARGRAWIGLPGNPLAALACWMLFGSRILRRLSGATRAPLRRHTVLFHDVRHRPGRCELRPAQLTGFDGTGREYVKTDPATWSHRVGNLPQADGLILIPADVDRLARGNLVEFLPFSEIGI